MTVLKWTNSKAVLPAVGLAVLVGACACLGGSKLTLAVVAAILLLILTVRWPLVAFQLLLLYNSVSFFLITVLHLEGIEWLKDVWLLAIFGVALVKGFVSGKLWRYFPFVALVASQMVVVIANLLFSPSFLQWAWGAKVFYFQLLAGLLIPFIAEANDIRKLWRILVLAAGLNVFLAVWQQAVGAETLMSLGFQYGVSVAHADQVLRAFGGLNDSFTLSYLMAMIVPFAAWQLFLNRATMRSRLSLAAFVSVGLAGLAITMTRGGVAALVLGTAVTALLVRRSNTTVILIGIAGAVVTFFGPLGDRIVGSFSASDHSFAERLLIWTDMLSHLSLFGSGLGTIGAGAGKIQLLAGLSGFQRDYIFGDNNYLTILYQVGTVGLLLFLVLLGYILRQAFLSAKLAPPNLRAFYYAIFSSLVGISISGLVANVWEMSVVNSLFWILGGFAIVGAHEFQSLHGNS